MAYTESKAYDLRNVQYQGTRIGGIDQIVTSPIQYQGTPVPYVKYKNTNIMHCYIVLNGDENKDYYSDYSDFNDNILAGSYSVSSSSKNREVFTDVPAPAVDANRTITYHYYITKWELTRTSGDKNESKYYLYAFTIALKGYYSGSDPTIAGTILYRIDKYDYLSTEDISLDTLAAKIEDPSGGTEGFTPPWKLGISTERILRNTRRERQRTDEVEYTGNFKFFDNKRVIESEGEPTPWGEEINYQTYNGIFNQGAEGLEIHCYRYSPPMALTEYCSGNVFNFSTVVDSKSQVDSDHVCITGMDWTSMHSSCWIDTGMDDRRPIYITDGYGDSISSDDFSNFPLIFLICSSCSNLALSQDEDSMVINYYREDFTQINANMTYNNYISYRDY